MTKHPVRLALDFANLVSSRLGGFGISEKAMDEVLAPRFTDAHAVVGRWRDEGTLGFIDLPGSTAAREAKAVARSLGDGAEDLLVLGIGGSALGTRTVRDALGGSRWNELTAEARGGRPRIHVLDNPDPDLYRATLASLRADRTLVNVVSKSGGTAETLALYQAVRGWMGQHMEPDHLRTHLVFTTDPERGPLRAIAQREGLATLDVPPNVGGRFSVLTPVGLFPAALMGVDPQALLDGAAAVERAAALPDLRANPAGLLAASLHAADVDHGCDIHVLMPYKTRLGTFGLWFQQLWAESLGKRSPNGGHVGPTPLPGIGASDQHAQVQLFMEGPRNKVVLFLAVPTGDDVPVPAMHPEEDALSLVAGHGLGELLNVERDATAEALRQAGRPNATLTVGAVDGAHLGALFHLFQRATVYAGALYGVNPLDQPGVELGKQLTRARLAGTDADPGGQAAPSAWVWELA